MRFRFIERETWPELAWLAQLRPGDPVIEVHRGRRVEIADEWFREIAWAGRYEQGSFDATDVVAGSGGLLRGDGALFVSPGSTVDRLQSLSTDSASFVSNSLTCRTSAGPVRLTYFHNLRWDGQTLAEAEKPFIERDFTTFRAY